MVIVETNKNMQTTITFRNYSLNVRVVRPDVSFIVSAHSTDDLQSFRRYWIQLAQTYQAPVPRWTGEEAGLVRKQLNRHGVNTLQEAARHFWLRHADDVYMTPHKQLRIFAAKVPPILAETANVSGGDRSMHT